MEQETLPYVHVRGIDHVEFRVKNAYRTAEFLCKVFGFTEVAYADATTGRVFTESLVLRQGRITIILSQAIRNDSYLANVVKNHGEGVHDVAFRVDDVASAHATALARGAVEAAAVREFLSENDPTAKIMTHSAIKTCGPVVHTLIDRAHYPGVFAPGFIGVRRPHFHSSPVGLDDIDHYVLNVGARQMVRWEEFYERVFGWYEFAHFTEEQISTDKAALRSVVMRSENGEVTMPINEPVEGKFGHIDEFLKDRGGSGVQHLAFRTENIVATVTTLKERGAEFLAVPDVYYAAIPERLNKGGNRWDPAVLEDLIAKLKPLGILIDQDEQGYLLQIFTKVILGSGAGMFIEIIQRCGCEGFGEGNFKALFEAIERAAGRHK